LVGGRGRRVAKAVPGEGKGIPAANELWRGITAIPFLLSSQGMEYRDYWNDLDLSPQDFDVEEFLREEQESERERLEQERERIEDLLQEREEIHSEAVEELESKLDWYVQRLEEVYSGFGEDRERQQHLKSRIEDFYSELRSERRQQWRDRIELEMELREVERSLEEVEEDSVLDLL